MDAAAGEQHAKTFKRLKDDGELTARVHLTYVMDAAATAADPKAAVAQGKAFVASTDQGEPQVAPGISARILKVFMDGVVNAPADTGAMLTPYLENQGTASAPNWVPGTNMGEVYFPASVIKPMMLEAVDNGLDMHLHATGDRAVRETLDAVEYVRTQRPRADFRPAIAHDETVADYPRFAPLNVSATMSFQWAQRAPYSIGDTENHLGPDRFARMEPFGSLRNADARVVFGSDWPIDPIDTFLALKVGVTRSGDPQNPHSAASIDPIFEGPINADPALSRTDALRAATIEAAYQLRLEKYVGSIEKGKFADLIALDKDFLRVPDAELARNQVLLTMSGGHVVAAKDRFAALMSPSKRDQKSFAHKLNLHGSAGHATVKGSPHGDGHNH